MKKILSIALIAASLAVSAQAVIVGASVGYLTDAKDEYIAARIGTVFSSNTSFTHIGEIEIGYSGQSESGIKAGFMPVTLNYRGQYSGKGPIGSYYGLGAGTARTDVKGYNLSSEGWSFAYQAFAGLTFKVSDKAHLNLGARYVWIDDVRLFSTNVAVGDDLSLECGFHVKF